MLRIIKMKITTTVKLEVFNLDYDIHCNPDNNSYNISNDCQYYTDHQVSDFKYGTGTHSKKVLRMHCSCQPELVLHHTS